MLKSYIDLSSLNFLLSLDVDGVAVLHFALQGGELSGRLRQLLRVECVDLGQLFGAESEKLLVKSVNKRYFIIIII